MYTVAAANSFRCCFIYVIYVALLGLPRADLSFLVVVVYDGGTGFVT
jgi:hypothetical protein